MIQNVLHQISGVELYGVVSIGLFVLGFLGLLAWAARLPEPFLNSMAALPLDRESETSNQQETHHE